MKEGVFQRYLTIKIYFCSIL